MFKTYQQAKTYLENYIPKAVPRVMQLERITKLCQLLGNPQNRYPIIHVAGTSGKGSTATFASNMLSHLGIKVGLHLSPYVESLTEEIQINNHPIPIREFVKLLNELSSIIRRIEEDFQLGKPTYFEILVAMTFLYFAQKKVDVAVIEVGLGGRLDATNIIAPSLVILTNVSIDHTDILGKSIYKIATDKMATIKPHAPTVVSGITQPSLQKMLVKRCHQLGVPLYLLGRNFDLREERLSLLGNFQTINYSSAAQTVNVFVKKFFPKLNDQVELAIKKAANSTFLPGRMEIASKKPLIMLDGAHNSAKMLALVSSLKQLYPWQKWICVVAIKKDKPYRSMIKLLNPITKHYIFTKFTQITQSGFFQAIEPKKLKTSATIESEIVPISLKAVEISIKTARKTGLPILITGSFYLLGEVRHRFITRYNS